jgi:HD-like signal output (HDOD) protein
LFVKSKGALRFSDYVSLKNTEATDSMELNVLFNQLHKLPSIPKVAQELILQFDNPSTNVDSVARNIALDPVIAAKVLRLANSARFRGAAQRVALETLQLRFAFPEIGAELARRWQLPKLIQDAIAYQARPNQAPADTLLPLLIAQAVHIAETVRNHGGVTDEAKEALNGPLFEWIDREQMFGALEESLEADKAFAQMLS